MNLFDRLKLSGQVLFGGTKALATTVPSWRENSPQYPEVNFESMVRHGWRKNELIFACIDSIANTAAQTRLNIMGRDGQVLEDHPLAELLKRPNRFMDEFDFWASVIIYQKLAGRAIYEKEFTGAGRVASLWPLRPDWIRPIPSKEDFLAGYEYRVPGAEKPAFLEPEQVLDFKLFDPINFYQGWAPVAVAARVGDVDNSETDYVRLFFQEGASPPGLLTTEQALTDAQAENLSKRWGARYGGYKNWNKPAVLSSGTKYQRTGLTFDEMGFEALDARNESRICSIMRVPPIIVGARVGLDRSTFSNYAEARKAWWEDTLVPMYKNFNDAIHSQLLVHYPGVDAEWDFDEVPALKEGINDRWSRATEALKAGGITVNMFLEEIGKEQIGPTGEVFIRPLGSSEVPSKTVRNQASWQNDPISQRVKGVVANNAPDDDERRKIEKELEDSLTVTLKEQFDRVTTGLQQRFATT